MSYPTGIVDGLSSSSSPPRMVPPAVLSAGLSVSVTPTNSALARAQYFQHRQPDQPWPDVVVPHSGSLSARLGHNSNISGSGSATATVPRSFSAASTPMDDSLDPTAIQLTPSEVREERELERTRRRLALRKKAERTRALKNGGGGGSGSGNSSLSGSPAPEVMGSHPNELVHMHPSLQHAATSVSSGFGSARSRTSQVNVTSPTSRNNNSTASFSSSLTHSLSSPSTLSSTARTSPDNSTHRIDIPSEPEDESTLLERANTSFWNTIKQWDQVQRQRALSFSAICSGLTGLGYLIICISVVSTTYASPAIHWFSIFLGLVTILLGALLYFSARQMEMTTQLLWLIFTGVEIGTLVLLTILSFHHDMDHLDAVMRHQWSDVLTADERTVNYHDDFDELRSECLTHFSMIGGGAIGLSIALITLLCIVATIRSHIFSEDDDTVESSARQRQYQQRLKNRQRMARLSAQMKDRRRLRKSRGRTPANMTAFTGVGSHPPASTGNWSDASVPETEITIQLAEMKSTDSTVPGASAIPSSLPLLPVDIDEQRYAGMLSEEIEDELERVEQKLEEEAQQHQTNDSSLEERKMNK